MTSTAWRLVGALAGLAAGIGAGIGLLAAFDAGAGGVAGGIGALCAGYAIAYLVARYVRTPGTAGGELMPGILIGLTAGINGALLAGITPALAAIAAVPLLAAIVPLARTDGYQAVLGWSNWLLPLSWPIVGAGLLFLLTSAIFHLVRVKRIEQLKVDAKTGTFVQVGGLLGDANAMPGSPGYNMGNFAFLRTGNTSDQALVEHEAGHTLNLAILGSAVHLIGALDENVLGGGHHAYTELLAEGNVPAGMRHGPIFPMWSAA